MVQVGKLNQLQVLRRSEFGLLLDGAELGEILLPRRFVTDDLKIGSAVEVFLFYDSEDRLTATTEKPKASVGDFALLKVVATEKVGSFFDWGLGKDLFLPFAEQTRHLQVGQEAIVFLYLDKSGRISASMRLDRHFDKKPGNCAEGQAVSLMIIDHTDIGYKALIDGKHVGVLYTNEVFQKLEYGQRLSGFIKLIREDGKIDLTLLQPGHKAAVDNIAPLILQLLEDRGGFWAINDKTSAEEIHELFGVSKKKYKIALGDLYKKRLISIDDAGIRLVSK